MGLREFTMLSFLALLLYCISAAPTMEPHFLDSLQSFSSKTFSQLFKSDGNTNIIFSPFSLQSALAMTRMGASGDTAIEMDHVLGFGGQTPQSIADNYHDLLSKYDTGKNLKVANKVYVKQGYALHENYKELLSKKFFSSAENVNFGENEKAAKTINTWVESKTNDKIQNLIKSSILSDDTRLVLVNAIHFKGEWENQFNPKLTKKEDFYVNEKDTVKVDMMSNTGLYTVGHSNKLDSTMLRLHYKDSDLSILIILPNQREGLTGLVEKLNTIQLHSVEENLSGADYHVVMPKFQTEYSKSYKSDLIKMGMQQVFGSGADLSKMLSSPEPLVVDDVIQKAFIEVNEYGTEAAAASAVLISGRTQPRNMIIDHPFYYAIISDDFVPIFEGTVVNF